MRVAGGVSDTDEKAMQGQPCPAVEFAPFRHEDGAWAGDLFVPITD